MEDFILISKTEEFLESSYGILGTHWDAPGQVADKEMPENFQNREKTHGKNGKFWGNFSAEESQESSGAFLEIFQIGEVL